MNNINGNYSINHVYVNSANENYHQHSTDDNFYELKLQDSLEGKYAIVLVGHSGNGYAGDNNELCNNIRDKIEKIIELHQLTANEVIVIAGGTPQGIGAVYEVACSMNLDTLGIVASQGEGYCSPQCNKLITVRNQDENDWSTRMPESGDEMVVAALRVAKNTGKGGELLAYNGGPQAYTEALAAAKDGHTVTLIRDFKPVDTGRDQPFNVKDNLRALRQAGVNASWSRDEYNAIWSEWARNAPAGEGEQRDVAVARMRDCLDNNRMALNLKSLGLSSLPEILPPHIEILDVTSNALELLPKNLPEKLTSLIAPYNCLQEIPGHLPSTIINMKLDCNDIETLGNNLPGSLRSLSLAENGLTSLPGNLPVSLEYIDVSYNQLTRFPASIMSRSSDLVIDAAYNAFSQRSLRELIGMTLAVNYAGPLIYFSILEDESDIPPRPLSESVQDWLPAQLSDCTWKAIETEENAEAFSAFLSRLGETRNTRENPAFKARVTAWLNRLAATPALREATFNVALEATASCEDRVTLAWNNMQKVALAYDVENGAWDGRLPELILAGREMFRLEQLEQAARDKVKTLRFVDEIEVYLAYQTGLRDALNLTSAGELMRYRDVSGVTPADLESTLLQVRHSENKKFPEWLVQWAPWKMALRRAGDERGQKIQERLAEAFEDSFQHRVNAALKTEGLEGIPDAEVAVGRKVQDEMQLENDITFTRVFIQNRYRTLMADKSPIQVLNAVTELASVATFVPALAAMSIRPKNEEDHHPGSLLAATVAGGGMSPLAEAWISLLQQLYKNGDLSQKEILSALLPHKTQDGVKSLAHAIIGTCWHSEATTKLCTLLSEVTGNDERIRNHIMSRLSMAQPGYNFRQRILDQPADFYKRAKQADKIHRNDTAKTLLKNAGLIPKDRELFRLGSGVRSAGINRGARTEALALWVKTERNWSGNFGDYAPGLISRLYPAVRLNINTLNARGELISRWTTGGDGVTSGQVIELNLQNNHYSPVINGKQQNVPADGDCFFYSFLTALNGMKPSEADIRQLRSQLAEYIMRNEEIADFIEIDAVASISNKDKTDARQIKNPVFGFDFVQKKIKEVITPQVLASHAAMKREKAELERAKKSTNEKLDEFNIREQEEKEKRLNKMVASFTAHSLTQESPHDRSRQEKRVIGEQIQAAKRLRNQEKIPSLKGYVLTTDPSLLMPRAKAGGRSSYSEKNGGTITDEQIARRLTDLHSFNGDLETKRLEQRLAGLHSFNGDLETERLEQRLAGLHSFNGDLETERLEQRLNNLRGGSAKYGGRNKQLAPPLKKD